jgi:hypothetical protein
VVAQLGETYKIDAYKRLKFPAQGLKWENRRTGEGFGVAGKDVIQNDPDLLVPVI